MLQYWVYQYRGLRSRLHEVLSAFLCPRGGQLESNVDFYVEILWRIMRFCAELLVGYNVMLGGVAWRLVTVVRLVWISDISDKAFRSDQINPDAQTPEHYTVTVCLLISHWVIDLLVLSDLLVGCSSWICEVTDCIELCAAMLSVCCAGTVLYTLLYAQLGVTTLPQYDSY